MSVVSPSNADVVYKIAYIGPEGSGKTSTLRSIHRLARGSIKGPLKYLATELAPGTTLELLTLNLGQIRGFRTRVEVCTAPGHTRWNEIVPVILKGASCVVFVADSQIKRVGPNLDSLYNFRANEETIGASSGIPRPIIYQFNKVDLPEIVEPSRLAEILGIGDIPYFTTVALRGIRVYRPLQAAIEKAMSTTIPSGTPEIPARA